MPGNPPSTHLLTSESNRLIGFNLEIFKEMVVFLLFSLSLARKEGILVLGHRPGVLSLAHLQLESLENLTGPM